MTHQHYINII